MRARVIIFYRVKLNIRYDDEMLDHFPLEIITLIDGYLDFNDCCNLRLVCKNTSGLISLRTLCRKNLEYYMSIIENLEHEVTTPQLIFIICGLLFKYSQETRRLLFCLDNNIRIDVGGVPTGVLINYGGIKSMGDIDRSIMPLAPV